MLDTTKQKTSLLSLVPIETFDEHYAMNVSEGAYFGFPTGPIIRAEENLRSAKKRSVAYFSMEFGLSSNKYNVFHSVHPVHHENKITDHHIFSNFRSIDYYVTVRTNHFFDLPIYSGGLGVLAGDTLKSAADRRVSLCGIGILWNKGYFKQNFWFKDGQIPEEHEWDPYSYPGLVPLKTRIAITFRYETIHLRLWKYFVYSYDKKHAIPLILLDSNLKENSDFERKLTDQLYRSDNGEWKILQRAILGLGGVKALEALGYSIDVHHLNEGHAALAFVQKAAGTPPQQIEGLKSQFTYTCHTPVAAGHDRFSKKELKKILPAREYELLEAYGQDPDYKGVVNLTQQAMNTSQYINAVAKKHGEITRLQFPRFKDQIQTITNGVHTYTWVSKSFVQLFDKYKAKIGDWRNHPSVLKNVAALKSNEGFRRDLWLAHMANKNHLCEFLKCWRLQPNILTLAWARRFAGYKRPSLIFQDTERLLAIAKKIGPIQIIIAGKSHPQDNIGTTRITEMLDKIDSLDHERDYLKICMLENYDTYFGKLLTTSVDVWLNNPLPPFEASGTSGMKAMLNGGLQLTTLDGWVVEAGDKDIGWIFGWEHHGKRIGDESKLRLKEDSEALYKTLEKVGKLYYKTNSIGQVDLKSKWIDKMVNAVSEAAYFSTDRMVGEYEKSIWHTK